MAACLISIQPIHAQPVPLTPTQIQPPPPADSHPKRAGPVYHIRLVGDLECAKSLRETLATLDEAAAQNSPLIILELCGGRARLDLLRELAQAIRSSKPPVVVLLAGSSDTKAVGPAQLCLGLVAQACYALPGVSTRGATLNPDECALAPDNISWSAMTSEIYEWIEKSPRIHDLPEGLAPTLVAQTRPTWALFTQPDGTVRTTLVLEPPKAGSDCACVITAPAREALALSIDPKAVLRLRLACDAVSAWSAIPPRELSAGVTSTPAVERTIPVGLSSVAATTQPLLDAIDRAIEDTKKTLKLPWPVSKRVSPSTYNTAGAIARTRLAEAASSITQLETLLEQYPEILRRPAPGQTEVAGKPSSYSQRWRSLIQSRRDQLSKLSATADLFENAKLEIDPTGTRRGKR